LESAREIVSKSRVNRLRIMFPLELSFIDANQFLSFPRFLPETIVSDPVKPGGKTGFAPEAAEVPVRAQKGFLRQVVGQGNVRANQLAEETPDTRLMIPDQFRKGVVVVINKNTCNEVGIG
jgi:hypothetical protein